MAKDTYWFPHDYEPTSDPKMITLLGKFGAMGYGVFWRIIEMLHSDEDNKLAKKKYIYSAIATQMSTSAEQVEEIVRYGVDVCELFNENDQFFWSERVFRNIEKKNGISKVRSDAGKESARIRSLSAADVEQDLTNAEQRLANVEQPDIDVQQNPTDKKRLDKIREINMSESEIFFLFVKLYRGTKRAKDTEFKDFKKKHTDWKEVIPLLIPALKTQIAHKIALASKGEFVADWKHLKTWLNQRDWEMELPNHPESGTSNGNGYAIDPQKYIHAQPLPKPAGWKPNF